MQALGREMGGECNVIHVLQSLEDAGIATSTQLNLLKCSIDLLEPAGWRESINGERETKGGPWGSDPTLHLPESNSGHVDGRSHQMESTGSQALWGELDVRGWLKGLHHGRDLEDPSEGFLLKSTKAPQKKKKWHLDIQLFQRALTLYLIYSLPLLCPLT